MSAAIVIASVHKRQYSETFIHNHVEHLPFDVHYLYGGYLPIYYGDDVSFVKYYKPVLHTFFKNRIRKNLIAYLKKNKIAAVLAEYGPVGAEMMPVCKALNIPLLVYFHGYDIYRGDVLSKYMTAYQQLFKEARTIFAVSKEMAMRLIELGASPRKVVLNPCGADLSLFTYHDAGANDKILFAAGRFEETKNPLATINAFALALAKVPEARLRMAGNGSLKSKAEQLVRLLKIEQSVDFTGVLSPVEVSEEMAQARAFVQHSMTTSNGEKEGAPVAIMEAGASGLPVIATRHAGIRDIVVEQQTGYLIEEGDIQGMAYYMVELLTDPDKAGELGLAGRERVSKHFSLDKNIRLLTQYIEGAIG